MLHQLLIALHLLGAIAWVGGMFFAYFCLRPAAAEILDPPQRLPLWTATLSRFLHFTAIAVAVIIVTGAILFAQVGPDRAPVGWHIMLALGLLMAAVFAYIYLVLFPRLRKACAAATWPAAAQTLNRIRLLVGLNLALALCVVVAAISAR